MGRIGLPEALVILAVILVLFGARKIPDLMKSLGIGIREFKSSLKGEEEKKQPPEEDDKPNDKKKWKI